jgi:low affinity Fe/Cu permease
MGIIDFEKSFASFASMVSKMAGSSAAFCIAALFILGWAVSGPYFGFSANWQMVVNTVTTIATFLMVFIIQNSQNRDGLALQIKLDEIIRAIGKAHNGLIDLEDRSEEELDEIKAYFASLAARSRTGKTKSFTGGSVGAKKSRKNHGTNIPATD